MQTLEMTYSSAVMIEDPVHLAGLALFYDKIWLPHPYDFDPNARNIGRVKFDKLWELEHEQNHYLEWCETNKELFKAGIVETLPDTLPTDCQDLVERINYQLGYPDRRWLTHSELFDGKIALAVHHLFATPCGQRFFHASMRSKNDDTTLKQQFALDILNHDLTLVSGLDVERLLKLRDRLQPYREGFRGYISRLSNAAQTKIAPDKPLHQVVRDVLAEKNVWEEFEQFNRTRRAETVSLATGVGAAVVGSLGVGIGLSLELFANGGALLGALVPAVAGLFLAASKRNEWLAKQQKDETSAFTYIAAVREEAAMP